MTYISFVEIFSVKAVSAFQEAGFPDNAAARYATLCFFGGALLTWLLDRLVHALMHAADALAARREARRRRRAAAAAGGSLGEGGPAAADEEMAEVREGRAAAAAAAAAAPVVATPSCADLTVATVPAAIVDIADDDASTGTATAASGPRRCSSCGGDGRAPPAGAMALAAAAAAGGCGGGEVGADGRCVRCQRALPIPKDAAPGLRAVLLADPHSAALARTGLLSALAVGLHNLPEGLATFAAALASPTAGAAIAVAIALHNIPEGVVVAVPTYYAAGSKWKGFWWSLVSGVFEPIGGLIGYALLTASRGGGAAGAAGLASPLAFGVVFAIVAGMMVYLSVRELLPTALRYDPSDRFATLGFFVGSAVMAASLLLFQI